MSKMADFGIGASMKERAGDGCCQKCIRVSMVLLLIFCIAQVVLAIMKYAFAANVSQAELLAVLLDAVAERAGDTTTA